MKGQPAGTNNGLIANPRGYFWALLQVFLLICFYLGKAFWANHIRVHNLVKEYLFRALS